MVGIKSIIRFYKSYFFLVFMLFLSVFLLLLIVLSLADMVHKHLILNYDNFVRVVRDQYVIDTILLTFYTSLIATLITIIFGTPLSYIIANYDFKGKSIIDSIINIPLMIPHSVAGLLIFGIFRRKGLIGAPFYEYGIKFEGEAIGIIIALLFVSMPIYLNTVRDGFKSINPNLKRVAASLGASERIIFTKINLPLNKRHIISGSVMCWARGISEFGAVILIAYYPMVAPVLIYYRFNTEGLYGSAPIALVLILISLMIFILIQYLAKKQEITE